MTVERRVLLVASGGGHWIQLARMSPAFEGLDAQYVTTLKGARAPSGGRPVAVVQDASRSSPFRMVVLLVQLVALLIRFRPDVVVTTGAAPGVIALRLGKMMGARTVWIDSIANSEEISLSGRLASAHADLWLTQWPHLVEKYPGLKCYGAVL